MWDKVATQRKLGVGALNDNAKKCALKATIGDNTQAIKGDDRDEWKKMLHKSIVSVLGFQKWRNRDYFEENSTCFVV